MTEDGYIIVPHNGACLLLDTGCPQSFGRGFDGLPGVNRHPPKQLSCLTVDWLSDMLEVRIDGVIGAELLKTHTLTINSCDREVVLEEGLMPAGSGTPLWDISNVPMLDVVFAGQVFSTVFDTGAPLGYVPRHLVVGSQPVDHALDFYPLYGYFQTAVYELEIRIGAFSMSMPFGVLPPEIEQAHQRRGLRTIVGLGLLRGFQVSLSLRNSSFRLTPLCALGQPLHFV